MLARGQPLSEQVRIQILEWIQSGGPELADGVLPSEAEMAERFEASRATVREALAQLERDRIIIRRHGSGTYINPALRGLSIVNELSDPLNMIEQQGYRASMADLKVTREPAGEKAGLALSLPPETEMLVTRVLYHADNRPAVWLEAVIPADGSPGAALPPHFSGLASFAAAVGGRAANHSVAALRAELATPLLAVLLKVEPGAPLIVLEETYLTGGGRPAFFSRMAVHPGILELHLVRNSNRPGDRVAIW